MFTLNVIMGKTLSGKSTTIQHLEKLNIPTLVTTTTRPKRTGEINNVDYIFINDNDYEHESKIGNVIAPRKYKVANHQTWYYFINKSTLIDIIENNPGNNVTLITDPIGYFELKDYLKNPNIDSKLKNIQIKGWYLDVPLKTRMRRYLSSSRQNENPQEVLRRLYDDEFHAFKILNDAIVVKKNNITVVKDSLDLIEKLTIQVIKNRIEEEGLQL